MSNTNKTEAPKASKIYRKSRGEHYKDIAIAILVTSIIAFIGGMQFSNNQNTAIKEAVSAVASPKAEAATQAPASK